MVLRSNKLAICTALLCACSQTTAQSPVDFERTELSDVYLSEGVATGDLNNDGVIDIVAGTRIWHGPDFHTAQDIAPTRSFPLFQYSDRFFTFVLDADGDGWNDVLTIGLPGQAATWFQNPSLTSPLTPWASFPIAPNVQIESPTLTDLEGNGNPSLVCGVGDRVGYLRPAPGQPTAPWVFHPISPQIGGLTFLHGLGIGDINGDGRIDIVTTLGWFEQPVSLAGQPMWPFRNHLFSRVGGGAQMLCYDVDGDSDTDVVTSLSAHAYGLSWFENEGAPGFGFIEHPLLPTTAGPAPQFSQLHALLQVDVDGDGLDDFITGKTFFAHNGNDPGALDPAVLVWFRLIRDAQGARFEQIVLDDDSGVGRQLTTADLDGDGRNDLITSNKKGVFAFRQKQLRAGPLSISATNPIPQSLMLDAGAPLAGRPYVMLGTASGVRPGTSAAGRFLPLNFDGYSAATLGQPSTPPFQGFVGSLDARGRAQAAFALPFAIPVLQGLELHHLALIIRPSPDPILITNAVRLSIL